MKTKPEPTTPSDFPRDYGLGAVSGVQPKLAVRKVGEKYVHGLTAVELYARYDACYDLVEQLAAYCHRKLVDDPAWPPQDLLEKVRKAVTGRSDWDFSLGEVGWMMTQLCGRMGWPSPPQS